MTAELFTPPLDDKKQQHPEKYNPLGCEDYKWETKEHENVRIIIICSVGLVLEDSSVISFHNKTQEDR